MAINERLVHTASAAVAGSGNQEEGLILHLDANDVDSYDGDGTEWVDITNHEYKPATNVSEHFNTVLYTGDGNADKDITGVGFQPDLVWIKHRDGTLHNVWFDSVRGAGKRIISNLTIAEDTGAEYGVVDSFDLDGFGLDRQSQTSLNNVNQSGENYVAWCFKAGGAPSGSDKVSIDGTSYATMTAAGLTDGTEPISKLSVNTKLGFSIVKYTAPALTGDTVAHGLGETPEMIILKSTSVARNWNVFHKDVGTSKNLHLNTADAASTGEYWTANSNTFSIQDYSASANWIAYAFTSKRGVSKVGSYTGTGAAGNKVYTGFEPAFVMLKVTNATSGWVIIDSKRNDKYLLANATAAEVSSDIVDFNSDGFTFKGNSMNGSGNSHIYLAFAKNTNETSLAGKSFYANVSSITSTSTSETVTESKLTDSSTKFGFGDNGATEANNTIDFTMSEATSVNGFKIGSSEQSYRGYTGTVKFYGSNDGTTYTLLGTAQQKSSGFALDPTRVVLTSSFDATDEYPYFRLTLSNMERGTYGSFYDFLPSAVNTNELDPVLHFDAADLTSAANTTWTDKSNSVALTKSGTVNYDDELGDFIDFGGGYYGNDTATTTIKDSNKDYTLEYWYNFDVISGDNVILGVMQDASNRGIWHKMGSSNLEFYNYKDGTMGSSQFSNQTYSTLGITTGKWYHITYVVDSSTSIKTYVDGELKATSTSNAGGTHWDAMDGIRIGDMETLSHGSDGKLGQMRIYKGQLTQDQIRQNYNFTKNYYPNGYNGTITGATWNSSGYFDFAASSNKIVIDNDKFYDNFTVSLWVKFDDVNPASGYAHNVFSKNTFYASSHTAFPFAISNVSPGQIEAGLSYGNDYSFDVTATGNISADTWYHVVVTARRGDKLKLYLTAETDTFNTTPTSEAAYTGTVIDGVNNKYTLGNAAVDYGGGVGKAFLDGQISKVKMYDKVLTASEISTQFSEGK